MTDEQRAAGAAAAEMPLSAWPMLDEVRRTRSFGGHGGPAPGGCGPILGALAALAADGALRPVLRARRQRRCRCQWNAAQRPLGAAQRPAVAFAGDAVGGRDHGAAARFASDARQGCPAAGAISRRFGGGSLLARGSVPTGSRRSTTNTSPVDLLYDYYWLTGDAFALAELRRMGSGLRSVLDTVPFLTSRGEGWCLQAGALIARATGDQELVAYLLSRTRSRVLPEINDPPATVALAQPPHESALGPTEWFDAPWQMAALVHGLHALFSVTEDPDVAAAAVRTTRIMAGPGWVEGVGPKYLVGASQAGRYILPVGFGPMEGTAAMQIGAFVLAAEMTQEPADRVLFWRRGRQIVDANWAPGDDGIGADRWVQLHLDREAEVR